MKEHSGLILASIFIVFLFVITMHAFHSTVDQDAARFGLMARHIVAGKHFPVFYYGQSYTGSPKAYFMAAVFALLGPTNFAVILSTALLSAGFVFLTFKLGREAYGKRVALLTVAYLALPPTVLGSWYTRPVPPYVELLFTGAAMMLLGYRLIFTELGGRKRCFNNFLFGFLAGLGWWLSPMILYYIVPLTIFWLVKRGKKLWREDLPVLVPAFLLGSLPFWLHNIYHNFVTLGIAQPLVWSQAGKSLYRMLFDRLPDILEISWWSGWGPVWALWLRRTLGAAYTLLIIYTLWVSRTKFAHLRRGAVGVRSIERGTTGAMSACRTGRNGASVSRKTSAFGITWLLLLFIGFVIWSYVTTGYQASKTERQLLPLYSAIPILLALSTSQLIDRRKWAGWVLCSVVLAAHAVGNVACWQDRAIRSFRKEHREMISFLLQKNLLHVTSDFFNAPGLSFESGESIIASDGFGSCTVPGYLNRVLSADNYACIFTHPQSRRFESGLRNIGASWEKEVVGRYEIYHSFSNERSYEGIIPRGWRAIASGKANGALAFDRILSTRWTTRCAQEAGQYFELDLGRVFRIGKVELLSENLFDYPRGLRILTSLDGKVWKEALTAASCFPPMAWCGPKPMWYSQELGAEFIFPAREARFIRIELTKGSKSGWWWSINEIFVCGPINSSADDYEDLRPHEVIVALEREGVENLFTDFWIASRLIETGFSPDRVSTIGNPFDYHNSLRPKPFPSDRTVPIVPGTGFFLSEREAVEVRNMLDRQGIRYDRGETGKFEIIKIVPQDPPARYMSVPHSGWKAKASPAGNDRGFAFDGRIETRWSSETTQFPGMVFELDMGKVVRVCGVEVNAEREREDQPVALEVWVSLDGREWERVRLWSNSYEFLWTGKHLLLSSKRFPVILYTFSPKSLRYIRLVQKGTDDLHYWSIREMNVYSPETRQSTP